MLPFVAVATDATVVIVAVLLLLLLLILLLLLVLILLLRQYCCYFCIYFCCYLLLLLLSLLLLMLLLTLVLLLLIMLLFDVFYDWGTAALRWQTVSVLRPPQSKNARYSSSFSVLRFFSFYAWVALLILSKTVFGVKIGTHHRLWAATEILLHPYRTSSHYISRY